jgi:hypothetical protein
MPIFASWFDLAFIMVFVAIVASVTALAVRLFGRRIARSSRVVAISVCGMTVPTVIFGLAIFQIKTAPVGPPPNDGPAMFFVALLTLVLISVPVSALTSVFLILRKSR